jgi:hypothetical protein
LFSAKYVQGVHLPGEKAQIREIIDLFDTDGSGSIDRKGLEAAMFALSFNTGKKHRKNHHDEVSDEFDAEKLGESVNLEQFKQFQGHDEGGDIGRGPGRPPWHVWFAFAMLCRLGTPNGLLRGLRGLQQPLIKAGAYGRDDRRASPRVPPVRRAPQRARAAVHDGRRRADGVVDATSRKELHADDGRVALVLSGRYISLRLAGCWH